MCNVVVFSSERSRRRRRGPAAPRRRERSRKGPAGVLPGETQFEERATAATTARRRNFVDPCHSSWSRCVEVRESDDACANASVLVS